MSKTKASTVLGIGLDTQALKVVLYDFASKRVVASKIALLDLLQGDGGVAEQQLGH